MKGFIEFMREQGVVGLAVGFVLGASVSKVVSSVVEDIVNPLVGLLLGTDRGLARATVHVFSAEVRYGHFLSILLDFLIIALVVYATIKLLKLDKLDKKK